MVVAVQRLGRYQYPDGSRHENWLTYSESRLQFEWGATKDPKKPGPLEDANQRYGVTYLVVFYPDDNPFTDHDESEDIEVLDTYTWDGKSQKSEIRTFSPKDLIGNKTGIVALFTVDILEVASDQIPGNRANRLPTTYYQDQSNNPMLMATRNGTNAHLVVRAQIPTSLEERIRIGIRQSAVSANVASADANPILGCEEAKNYPEWTDLYFNALNGSKNYEVVGGYDKNKNNKLEPDEVITVFRKTPPIKKDGSAYTGGDKKLKLLDKIVIVTEEDYVGGRNQIEDYGDFVAYNLAFPNGSKLIKAFSRGEKTISVNGIATHYGIVLDASVIPSPDGLSHPVGGKWTSANTDLTHRIVFPAGSDLSQKIIKSKAFENMYEYIVNENKNYFLHNAKSVPQRTIIKFNYDNIDFATSDNVSDVQAALGKCKFSGSLVIDFYKNIFGNVVIKIYKCVGEINDLYDFAWGTKPAKFLTLEVDAKYAAMTQAGHATLASSPYSEAGKVFYTRVLLDELLYGFEYTMK